MMENIDNFYNKLLNKLHDTKPEIGDPNALTDSIMNSLHKTSGSNIKRIIRWTRPVMTTAALILFGLLIIQQLDKTKVLQASSLVYIKNLKPITIPANCFYENMQKGIINKSPLSIYLCYIKQTELAKKKASLLLMNQILKYHIKSSK